MSVSGNDDEPLEGVANCGGDSASGRERAELRDRALRLLAIGVGDHTPVEVQEQVAKIARRLAQLEPPAHELR